MEQKKRWYRGHLGRFWGTEYKDFSYVRQPVTQQEIDEWVNKGYDYVKSYTGEMYDNRNPMPEWTEQLKKLFDFKNLTFTFYRMNTLDIMPEHKDHFRTYMNLTGAKYDDVYRILLMLEDWKPGHYLEIDGVGIVNWVAGDYFVWENSTPHAASNIGTEPRYSLQITGERIQGTDVWRKLHWFNIPKLTSKRESEVEPYIHHIRQKCFKNHTKPLYIYMYNQAISELDNITHDQETIDFLNKEGIDFYLYEPLCSYVTDHSKPNSPFGSKHDRLFYSEFTGHEDPSKLRADELNSILNYATKNNLTNITVHTCDYNMNYPYCDGKLKLLGNDLYVKTARPIKVSDLDFQPNFTKKFISANWRYTPHRHIIAAAISQLSSYVSWYYKSDFHVVSKGVWYDFERWKENSRINFDRMIVGIQNLNRNGPFNLDLDIKESILIRDKNFIPDFPDTVLYDHKNEIIDGHNNALESFYKDIFCDVVTESRYAQHTANYSEKVYQPMWYKKPFVLVAPPHTLQLLRDIGFKTFSEFWDESYDNYENHEERMFKIFEVIDFIDNKSIEELQEMYKKMYSILQHNYDLLESILLDDTK